ncbi:phage portal protein [Bradyrhizobium sp. 153]|uniref:phage portal protein n=1 Tax=Bradyrhizobium sp. 153 TaxID=2782627 RepID=UPI001FF86EEA|nr:phage portal protein [Bradyrhizobium sp. 153]MCK1668630.1 phage portal protein [Bradyrhizobium sp. 153]
MSRPTAKKRAPAKSAAKPKVAVARRAVSRIQRKAAPAKPKRAATKSVVGAPARRTFTRGMDAGKTGRRLTAIPTNAAAINTQIRKYGKNVVARSRYLALNNPYAAMAKEAYVSALVGSGIKPSPLIKDSAIREELNRVWRLSTDEMDADNLSDFYGMQATIASEMFEAGECFVRFRSRRREDGLIVPMQLQLLPSEMLDTGHNEVLPTGGRIECGIEFSPIGARVAYWFYRQHPGEYDAAVMGNREKTRVPAEEVMHLFRPVRAGQIRGIPHTLAGMVTLAMLDLYDDAELERKRVAALFGAFVTRDGVSDEENPFAGTAESDVDGGDFSLEPGAVVDLSPGQDIKFAEPADVGATYEPFQYRALLRAAAGFGTTYADMTGDLRMTSYGSIRAGLVGFRRRIEAQQHHVMIFQFCRVVWKLWFETAVLNAVFKTFTATLYVADPLKYRDVKWITPKWEWIDPLKDRQAEKLAVDSGFKSRSDVIEAEGYDPEEVDARIKADQDRAAGLGITFIQLSSSIVVAPDDGDSFGTDQADIAPAAPGVTVDE